MLKLVESASAKVISVTVVDDKTDQHVKNVFPERR